MDKYIYIYINIYIYTYTCKYSASRLHLGLDRQGAARQAPHFDFALRVFSWHGAVPIPFCTDHSCLLWSGCEMHLTISSTQITRQLSNFEIWNSSFSVWGLRASCLASGGVWGRGMAPLGDAGESDSDI